MMKEAMLYHKLNGDLRCDLCAHRCRIKPGLAGVCLVRRNDEGKLYTLVYGRTIAQDIDPIEKKPLFHFLPGSKAYSIATVGCNFHCNFCQNWEISQALREEHFFMGTEATPEEIVKHAIKSGCSSIAYTYTEPTIFFEYAYDTAKIAKRNGLKNIFVTNGYETTECIDMIAPYLDGANVDLKSFSDSFYRKIVGAKLQPIKESLIYFKKKGIWLEVTTLIIPEWNDNESELKEAAEFIAKELGVDTPWHLSRFYPGYKMIHEKITPAATLMKAMKIGQDAGLHYVYAGNLPSGEYENTYCPNCNTRLIIRSQFTIIESRLQNGECPECGYKISGIWNGRDSAQLDHVQLFRTI
jgi:pyruvate formate lyase activating enzyme